MHDSETGEVLVYYAGALMPETTRDEFVRLRWELAHAGLVKLDDGVNCQKTAKGFVLQFFARPSMHGGRAKRAPEASFVPKPLGAGSDLISPCTSDTPLVRST